MVVGCYTTHTKKKEFFFLLFFCVFFLIFKFSTKKGFIQSKANGLGFDPQWRYCSKYPDDVTFFDRASIALTFRRRVGASIAQPAERSPLKFLSAAACACAFGFFLLSRDDGADVFLSFHVKLQTH